MATSNIQLYNFQVTQVERQTDKHTNWLATLPSADCTFLTELFAGINQTVSFCCKLPAIRPELWQR